MLDHNQLTPEEAQEQNQLLIQDLGRYYNTQAEDKASLARIHTRLLEKTAASLPVARHQEVGQPPLLLQTQRARKSRSRFGQALAQDRLRYRFLGTLAAAVLLVVLVGSFALLLHHGQATGAVAHGWSLVAKFSGTGNQTITNQNIEVGNKFGWLINCTNTQNGEITVKFNTGNSSSNGTCSGIKTEPLGPGAIITSPVGLAPVQTIEVTTDASTSWELFLFRGTYYPPLSIDTTNWHPLLNEMDGSGNGTWSVNVILPRTWALLYVCHGTGNIQLSLEPSNGDNTSGVTGASSLCNGQMTFDVSDIAGQSEKVSQIQITTGADNDWQVLLIACTNGKPHCGITTVMPTGTP